MENNISWRKDSFSRNIKNLIKSNTLDISLIDIDKIKKIKRNEV